jgi:hypothetical protein
MLRNILAFEMGTCLAERSVGVERIKADNASIAATGLVT